MKEGELIIESGLVWKGQGRSAKKRHLILTNSPRIFYIDPKSMKLKGEIPWSGDLRPEVKNNISWFIHTVIKFFNLFHFNFVFSQNVLICLMILLGILKNGWILF